MMILDRCIGWVEAGCTVVTASNGLARRLHHQIARRRLEDGNLAWETPDILPWQAWLRRFHEDGGADGPIPETLINSVQSRDLWRLLVEDSEHYPGLLHPGGVARLAAEAWQLLRAWRLDEIPDSYFLNDDVRAFHGWAQTFREECGSRGWIDPASLESVLEARLRGRSHARTGMLVVLGFDTFTPQQDALLAVLRQAGCGVEIAALEGRNRQVRVGGFPDRGAEIHAAASWARTLLDRKDRPSIGIVSPDLAGARHQIEYGFDDVLLPAALLDAPHDEERPYVISLGLPLAEYPIIAAALGWLELGGGMVSVRDIGALLRSPFQAGFNAEAVALAKLDAGLRGHGATHLHAESLLQVARTLNAAKGCAVFLDRLQTLVEENRAMPRIQGAHDWAIAFTRLLQSSGWPGERPLNSREHQCVEAWRDALRQFISLDIFAQRLDYATALATLRRIVTEQSFQPQTGETPVQITGIGGAGYMEFDELWVLGMDEDTWPGRAQPNPFLPVRLQRELAMPRASADRELAHARSVTSGVIGSAPSVVISFPRNDGDRPLRPSPVIAAWARTADPLEISPVPRCADRIFAAGMRESITDESGPPLPAGGPVRGGTQVISDQAACPFRSFARHRLNARALDAVDVGISRLDRGRLIHHVMQHLWQSLKDHATLAVKPAEEIRQLVDESVGAAMKSVLRRRAPPTRRFAELEAARLGMIAAQWLALEQQRRRFTVIACEEQRVVELAGLEFHLRIDRIDEVDDLGWIIIDYKTGEASPSAWFGERPDEPQIPLYAIAMNHDVAAVAFAHVRAGRPAFEGLAVEAGLLPGVEVLAESRRAREFGNFENLLDHWRGRLAPLAEAFRSGDARVLPKSPRACRQCDLHGLCRINDYAVEAPGAEDA